MNQHCYRLVFNRARGLLMAVGEIARSHSAAGRIRVFAGSAAAALHPALAMLRTLTMPSLLLPTLPLSLRSTLLPATLLAKLLPVVAHAQIIPDAAAPANHQAIVSSAANGVPLVHIQTPTAGGVSRNVYSQFDVHSHGAILNNAHQATQTALGGWVQANPLLDKPASVIVNEVNSSNPSLLHGYVEVAGQRAQVVVANPSGISCDGCGFINASRATITTGVPQYGASGNLDSYLLRRGTVRFNGDGLDANSADFTEVLARAVQVNAALRARQLNVVAGSNEIRASDLQTSAVATDENKPAFALDVSALGGMYAGKIWLIGTEAGVGVRHAGKLGGGASEIHITAAGKLEVTGEIDSAGRVDITTVGIDNRGSIQAANSVSLQSKAEINNTGLINGGDVLLKSATINNRGTGRIYGDHIALEADTVTNEADSAADSAAARAAPVIAARSRLDIGAEHITNRDGALLYSAGDLAIGRYLDSNQHATGQARRLDNLSAHIDAEGDMDVAVDDIRNMNLHYSTRKQTRSPESVVEVAGEGSPNRYATDVPDVYAYIDESYHLHTPEGNYERWLRYRYQRTVTDEVTASSAPAEIIAGGKLRVRGETLTNDKSRILAGGELDVQVATLNNIDATGTRATVDVGTVDSFWRDHRKGRDRTGSSEAAYEPPPLVQSMSLGVVGYEGQTQSTAAHGGDISQGQGLVTRNLSLAVPNTSLYCAAPLARGYMVETDPRFTSYKAWLGSDYLLQQLALDPQQMQKRLGDGFYEQRLVREQVAQLTGRRFLPGYANDEAQFQALMDHASTFAKAYALRPGIALSAEQMALLTSDIVWLVERDVTLLNGQATRALVPQVYMRVREGDLRADGALLAGAQVKLSVTGDLNNSATIAGGSVGLHANNVNNAGSTVGGNSVAVAAVRDINSVGGSIKAESALTLSAGNDITIASTTRSSSSGQDGANGQGSKNGGGSRTDIDRVAGLYVSRDDGQLVVAAGHNLTIKGAVLQQGTPAVSVTNRSDTTSSVTTESGRIMLAAGNDVVLDTVTEARSERIDWGGGTHRSESRRTDVAATVNAAGAVNIIAGRDIVSRGAQISTRPSTSTTTSTNTQASPQANTQSGDIHLTAARDVMLSTAKSQVSVDESHRHTCRGFLSRTTTSTRESLDQTTQSGTLLSGERVSVQSGQDIQVIGSNVASSTGTALEAGRNVSIEAATNTRREIHLAQTKTSGLMSSGGFGITIGNRSVKSTSDTTATTAVASTVGSTRGDVQMSAGDAFTQTGSNVLAQQGNVGIAARKVDITEARNSETTVTETQFKQSGLTLAVSNPIVTAVQTAQAMGHAAANTTDTRMKALAAANTAMAAKNAVDAVIAGQGSTLNGKADQIVTGTDAAGNAGSRDANAVDKIGGIQLSVSLGSTKSDNRTVVRIREAIASTVATGGDVTITAQRPPAQATTDATQSVAIQSNAAQSDTTQSNTSQTNLTKGDISPSNLAPSDITVQGSRIAGQQVKLIAEGALNMQAASNTHTQTSSNSSASNSIGVILDSKGGIGVNVSGSRGRGSANGEDQRFSNTDITDGQQVVLQSDADTTIKGASVSAPQISVTSGGALAIESLQDSSSYQARQRQIGGSATLGTAPSANVAIAKSNIDSTYRSVVEQSGIKAGDDSFTVKVAGDTTLTGGVISSMQAAVDAKRNQFSAGGQPTTTDIDNHAHYTADAVSVNLGTGFSA